MSEPFFEILEKIDRAIANGPSNVEFSRDLQPYLGEQAAREYFYRSLQVPDWLEPLTRSGEFRNVPPPQKDTEKGILVSQPWPQSRYLARMASIEPNKVLDVALQIANTKNVRVWEDLIDMALAMPADLAAKLAKETRGWMESSRLPVLPHKLGDLVSRLARGGQIAAALDVARTLLAVFPGAEVTAALPGGTYQSRRDPEGRFGNWYYGEILKKNVPDLVTAGGGKALQLLCDLLNFAIQYKRGSAEEGNAKDYSYVWRPAIEDHSQNHPFGISTLLVSAVRDAAENLAETDPKTVPELLRALEGYKWTIFQRVALHLLRLFSDAAASQISDRLTDRTLFDETGLRHEYFLLLQSQFAKLSSDAQKTILAWIEDGPNLETFKEYQTQRAGKEPSQEDTEEYKRVWQLKRLAPLRDVLPPNWKEQYLELVQKFGEPAHPDLASYTTSWVGPTSPKTADDLRSMSMEELIQFLKNWNPPDEHWGPTPEGLGRELKDFVASDPQKFAEHCNEFQNLDPTYVRALLSGFWTATGQKSVFSWPPVLGLCRWVVVQPRGNDAQSSARLDRDLHWGWARKTIAELLEHGFQDGPTEISFDFRRNVWEILRPITDDPEPTPEYEAQYGGSNMDPDHISINTTRGQAMHALVRYALWVRRHIEKEPDAKDRLARGFDELPEVRDVLDAHLATDPSLAIRSVYGRFIPWFFLLDPTWARTNVSTIFPVNESLRPLFDAAWNTYVLFCQPYDNVLEVLWPVYAHAIKQLGGQPTDRSLASDPEQHLAAHLITYYWRGKLDINEASGLLQLFWSKAEPRLRGYALEHAGRSLSNTRDEIPHDIIERFRQLWEFRLRTAKASSQSNSYKEELAAFSWWFSSGKIDNIWAIKQLQEVLKLVNKIAAPDFVMERLTAIAGNLPRESVEVLNLLVESELEPWEIFGWHDEAIKVLATAIQSEDAEARNAAIDLVHRLGAMGHLEFRDVLPKSSA